MNPPAPGGLRNLLQRLRDAMQAPSSDDARLTSLVELVAEHFAAEVCSIYILRESDCLELFATKGLRANAVHHTRLRLGEGLVGDIAKEARPLALIDAQVHEKFAYRPETGEEIYHSFLGVPLLRAGSVLGTIAVQNVERRSYRSEEIEALETVATVLGEWLGAGGLETLGGSGEGAPLRLAASVLSPGLAIGEAVIHGHNIVITRVVSDDPAEEGRRLESALTAMRRSLDNHLAETALPSGSEHREILETFRLFADDRGWPARIREAIASGLTAEAAVDKVLSEIKAQMARVADPYLRERLADFNDLGTRLLRHLLGRPAEASPPPLPEAAIVIAGQLGPAELLDYDRDRLKGLVLTESTRESHVAIIARALGVPVLGDCRGAMTAVRAGDRLIADADAGQLLVRPAPTVVRSFADSLAARARHDESLRRLKDLPALTRDGERITLLANAGLLLDLPLVVESGAEGIGLYRTEMPFLVRDQVPDVEAQRRLYQEVLDRLGTRPVVFRTLDIGGDKVPGFWAADHEENPALGWRGLRVGLDREDLLRDQLRAFALAARGRPLRILLPLVRRAGEIDDARQLLEATLAELKKGGETLPAAIALGAMIEVPALLLDYSRVLERADFVAVGSNDLVQFLFAADRASPRMTKRYHALLPEVLTLFKRLVAEADAAGKPISLCGEAAGHPLEAMAFIACGLRTLSINPAQIGTIKALVRELDAGALARHLDQLLAADPPLDLAAELQCYAEDAGLEVTARLA